MKKQVFPVLLAILALSGCMEKDVYQGPKEEEKEFNEFGFSTVASATPLQVSYLNCGVQASVYFELYDENPVTVGEYNDTKREDVTPLFAAYTGKDGVFKGNVDLPAYLKKVYIYTPAFYAQTLIEAEVTNGSITATDGTASAERTTRVVTGTGDKSYDSYMVTENPPKAYSDVRWKTWLGEYDKKMNGDIKYKYSGSNLSVDKNAGLYEAHSQVINVEKECPKELRSSSDLLITEDAEIAVTFLGQNTCWNCSMGYYYYKDNKPTSLDQVHVIMLFPNTQDGLWSKDTNSATKTAGIDRGTAAQLKYYPNIANNDSTGGTTVFPANYRIGLVIANNAWSNRIPSHSEGNQCRSATSEDLSVNHVGSKIGEPRTAAYGYGDYVMISFEDYVSDKNFSDVVVTMKSNPVEAFVNPDLPVVNPDNNHTTATILKGIYAFEDLWPNEGDYDMNDVLVRHDYEKVFDKENKIYSEAFIFKTFQNYAGNNNGLAFKVNGSTTPSAIKYEIRKAGEKKFSEAQFTREESENVFLLTGNVKENMGAEYKVTFIYGTPITKESSASPFIYKNTTGGKRWEMHIAQEAPTSSMDTSYFGQGQDASKPVENIYFVRKGNCPFAFFLAGANEQDLSELLNRANESTRIDQLYEGYTGWAESNGNKNPGWYKK